VAEQRTGSVPELTLREIAPAAFLPPALFAVGQGAIAPVVVITATDLGASPAIAALVVAAAGVGQIIADIPAGALVQRFGERTTMLGAAALTVLALLGCLLAPTLAVFVAAIFLTGAGTAVWLLARQAYVPSSCRSGCGPRRCPPSAASTGSACSSARSPAVR